MPAGTCTDTSTPLVSGGFGDDIAFAPGSIPATILGACIDTETNSLRVDFGEAIVDPTMAQTIAIDVTIQIDGDPFADGLMEAAAAGATCVIQPGGSMRDDEVIAAADEAGIAMVFTGMRHFRH